MNASRILATGFLLAFTGAPMASDMQPKTAEALSAALLADTPHASIPKEMDIYAPFLGRWKIEGTEWRVEGEASPIEIDVAFGRVLDGRAIQDVWAWQPDTGGHASGTTLRLYDPVERIWHVTWLDPVERKRVQLTASKVGEDIVQIGKDAKGKPRRWTFTQITPSSFVWRGEHSDDGGRSWKLNAEYRARRVGG